MTCPNFYLRLIMKLFPSLIISKFNCAVSMQQLNSSGCIGRSFFPIASNLFSLSSIFSARLKKNFKRFFIAAFRLSFSLFSSLKRTSVSFSPSSCFSSSSNLILLSSDFCPVSPSINSCIFPQSILANEPVLLGTHFHLFQIHLSFLYKSIVSLAI